MSNRCWAATLFGLALLLKALIPASYMTVSSGKSITVEICSGLLTGGRSVEEQGEMLIDIVEWTINGRLTAAELLGHREFTLTKLYRSA